MSRQTELPSSPTMGIGEGTYVLYEARFGVKDGPVFTFCHTPPLIWISPATPLAEACKVALV